MEKDRTDYLRGKMQQTLDYCRDVVEKRTKYRITQERVEMRLMHE